MSERSNISLLCQLSHASSLQEICDLACQITGNPVFISDMAHTILAYTKCVEIEDPTWQTNVVRANLDVNTLKQDREVGSVHSAASISQRPVLVEDDFLPYARIIKTLSYQMQTVGTIVLTAYLRPFEEPDIDLLDLISSFVVPQFIRESIHLSEDHHSLENYFMKLLTDPPATKEVVDRHLEAVGYQPKPYSYVIAFCLADAPNRPAILTENLEKLRQEFSGVFHCPVLIYNTLLLCVYGSDTPVHRWPEDVPGLEELLQSKGMIAGVSRLLHHPFYLRDRYMQAQAVLEKGRKLGRLHNCFQFDSLSSFLLFDRLPPSDLHVYCHEQILTLLEYDRNHDTQLCATLQVYLEQAKSLSKTAELLFIHRNTVRYRINRCMELLENRLEDGNEIFAYILSLRILEYQVKIHSGHLWDIS